MDLKLLTLFLAGLAVVLMVGCQSGVDHPQPVNPDTIPEARALLDFLYEIRGEYVLSGHHNGPNNPLQYSTAVEEMTGSMPVVWGSDFSFNFRGNDPAVVRSNMVETAKELYARGHIITLMWHACFPADGDSCDHESIWLWKPGVSEQQWDSLTTPGTQLNQQWREQVDHVAVHLKELQKANVPVLWRPYHEMNGIWFWWCDKRGEDGFQKLWKMMYDRLVNHHNLNNLIWVWNPNAPRDTPGDEAYDYDLYFPGLEYVDVLAADVYHNDYKQSHHDDLIELAGDKVISLGEIGKMPEPDILDEQPQWTWFMGWANWLFKANDPDSVRALYNSPRVLTMDEIEKNAKGEYRVTLE
ncbi:MAG: glycosyl hydrolase [candidate division KSB1 bacterium]|nr:glycosyl hydrolase [candidate division KSB1 bacterium]